ncbi:hypothetical protein SAMN02910264_02140 [Ruminococcaceae bacterium YAD3003]|nr:hypothetical protein SAMN02910264_02140 [Ruminococcaceae bacterium YAD3003]
MGKRRFDYADNRVDYSEILRPDSSYELEYAVCLTYSLDTEALLGVLLNLGKQEDISALLKENKTQISEAIIETGKKLSVFYNVGCIKISENNPELHALLADRIHQVKLPDKKNNFHPKLWVLQYRHDKEVMIKIVVLSRNLTFDKSLDVAVEMTGIVGKAINAKNQPIADLLTFVSQFNNNDKQKKNISDLINNVRKVDHFELLDCFDDYSFHAFGIYEYKKTNNENCNLLKPRELYKNAKELLGGNSSIFVISPFLEEETVLSIIGSSTRSCLISRERSVTRKVYDAVIDGTWVINPDFYSEKYLNDNGTAHINHDVHAKLFYVEKTKEPHKLFLGSLNASRKAFYGNVELLLELTYKKSYISYDGIFQEFLPENNNPFIRMNPPDNINSSEEEVFSFKDELYGIENAVACKDENGFTIAVSCMNDFEGVEIYPYLLQSKKQPLHKKVIFSGLKITEVSKLFVIEKAGHTCLVTLEVAGIPEVERENAILNAIIDKTSFMSYVKCLLGDSFSEMWATDKKRYMLNSIYRNGEIDNNVYIEAEVYESMLKTAANNPQNLREINQLVQRVDKEKVPEDFRKLLDIFISAVGKESKRR